MTDPEQAFRPGNVINVLQQARKEGKIRFIGLLDTKVRKFFNMIRTAAKRGVNSDTVQCP